MRHRGIRPVAKSFETKTQAIRFARLLEAEIDRGIFVDRSECEQTTVGDLIDRYLREITPTKKSARAEKQRLNALKTRFGAFFLSSVRSTHITAYRDARLNKGLAGATVVKELNSLSHLFDIAIKDWGFPLPANPAKLVRRPKIARGRERRLLAGEQEQLFASCQASRAKMLLPAVQFAIETGVRMGELLSLEWRHVDTHLRVATLPDTKNGESRQVPLSSAAVTAITSLPRHIKDGRVFWAWSRSDSLENAWRRAVKAAGLKDLRFHDLRHEAVSRLFERGLNPMEVSAISGHKTLQMLKRYTHLKAEELAKKLA